MGEINTRGIRGIWEFLYKGFLVYSGNFKKLFLVALIGFIPTIIRLGFNQLRFILAGNSSLFMSDLTYYTGILISIFLLYYSTKILIAQLRFTNSYDVDGFCSFKDAYKMKPGTVWLYVIVAFLASISLFAIALIAVFLSRLITGLGAGISLNPMVIWETYSGWFSVAMNIVLIIAAGIYLVPFAIEGKKPHYFKTVMKRIKKRPGITMALLLVLCLLFLLHSGFGRILHNIWRGEGSYIGTTMLDGIFEALILPLRLVLAVSWYRITNHIEKEKMKIREAKEL